MAGNLARQESVVVIGKNNGSDNHEQHAGGVRGRGKEESPPAALRPQGKGGE
jgi:hypothetical protein